MTPNRLVIHNAGSQFAAPGARVQHTALSPAEVLVLVQQASADSRR
jgi:hypothetical protein